MTSASHKMYRSSAGASRPRPRAVGAARSLALWHTQAAVLRQDSGAQRGRFSFLNHWRQVGAVGSAPSAAGCPKNEGPSSSAALSLPPCPRSGGVGVGGGRG